MTNTYYCNNVIYTLFKRFHLNLIRPFWIYIKTLDLTINYYNLITNNLNKTKTV